MPETQIPHRRSSLAVRKHGIVKKYGDLLLFFSIFFFSLIVSPANFRSIDEVALYTTATNLTNHGQLQIPQLGFALWGLRPGEAVVMLTETGELYTKKSPAVILALWPLLKAGELWTTLPQTRVALLLGPIILAATAIFVVKIAGELGYRRPIAWTAALLLATGSLALPYSQTIFGELLAMLALTVVVWAFVRLPVAPAKNYFWAGCGCAVAIGCNVGYGIAVPTFLIVDALRQRRNHQQWPAINALLLFAVPLMAAGGGLALYNLVRFDSILESGYQFAADQEGFSNPLGWGLIGLWLSPARGFLWFNPLAFLGLWGWPAFHKKKATRPLSWLIGGLTVTISVVFATWWQWWGGYGWGPRFLLPLVPLFAILALPVLEKWVFASTAKSPRNWRSALIGVVILAGFLAQTAGVAVNYNDIELLLADRFPGPTGEVRPLLYHHDPALVFNWGESPLLWHWRYILDGQTQLPRPADVPDEQLDQLIEMLSREWRAGDVVLHLGSTAGQAVYEPGKIYPVYGLPLNLEPREAVAQRLFSEGTAEAGRVWIIAQLPPGSPLNWYEKALWDSGWAGLKSEQIGNWVVTLMVRPLAEADPPWRPIDAQFGPLALQQYRFSCQDGGLQIGFQWRLEQPTSLDLTQFVHLMINGEVVQQQDRFPWNGFSPTSQWVVGEPLRDHFAFELEGSESCSDLGVGIGWYDWRDPTSLPAELINQPLPNGRLVIEIEDISP